MALDIYTNNYSNIAANNLASANSSLTKSIQRLSSGLRINSASDDASGLAISEKLRGQIRGLAKANMNAQDAVSFLQTAEGGMEVIGNMVQRMRELAVQAGNGTYTSNDRKELQKEVDQLKSEVNRISSSTEFNTKKLLTGEAAALWSTNDPSALDAIVKGAPAEGNYRLTIQASGGQNNVYKSDIMTVINADPKADAHYEYKTKGIEGTFQSPSDQFNFINVTVGTGTSVAQSSGLINTFAKTGSTWNTSGFSPNGLSSSQYVVISANADVTNVNAAISSNFDVTVYDAVTGEAKKIDPSAISYSYDTPSTTGTVTIAGVGTITLDPSVVAIKAGDKSVYGYTQAVATVDPGAKVITLGNGNYPTITSSSPQAQFALVDIDTSGNLIVGTGTVKTATNGSLNLDTGNDYKVYKTVTGTGANVQASNIAFTSNGSQVFKKMNVSVNVPVTSSNLPDTIQLLKANGTFGIDTSSQVNYGFVQATPGFLKITYNGGGLTNNAAGYSAIYIDAATGQESVKTISSMSGSKITFDDTSFITLNTTGTVAGNSILVGINPSAALTNADASITFTDTETNTSFTSFGRNINTNGLSATYVRMEDNGSLTKGTITLKNLNSANTGTSTFSLVEANSTVQTQVTSTKSGTAATQAHIDAGLTTVTGMFNVVGTGVPTTSANVYAANATLHNSFSNLTTPTYTLAGTVTTLGYFGIKVNTTIASSVTNTSDQSASLGIVHYAADGTAGAATGLTAVNYDSAAGNLILVFGAGNTITIGGITTGTSLTAGSELTFMVQVDPQPAATNQQITDKNGYVIGQAGVGVANALNNVALFDSTNADGTLNFGKKGNIVLSAAGAETSGSATTFTLIQNDVITPGTVTSGIDFVEATTGSKYANSNTKLKDIALFTNKDGRMILDNAQDLTLFGNGSTVTLSVEGNDTVEAFRKKLNDALLTLGMGTGNPAIDDNLVKFIGEGEETEGNYAVAGTFVIQAGVVGDNSKISIIGDEGLVNALSLANIQKGENSELTVTVTDAHTDKVIGTDTVSDNTVRNIIKGVDVKFKNPKLTASLNTTTGEMSFVSGGQQKFDLHVVSNKTDVQIGANEGQIFDISIGRIDTASLGIDDAFVLTMEDSQKAITKFDQALGTINSARATIGAQINRLEYTMQNLSTSKLNLVTAESRIRDADIAEESANFSKNQILVNAAVAMLAQANQLPQSALQLIGR